MKTILLIDDDEQIRSSFGAALRHHGYRVLLADSGLTGLEMARQHLPDLILSDINMPGGDGQALLQSIRASPELNAKQVVLMTGRPDLMAPRKGMEAGADDFLVKPVSLADLISCVEARLNRAEIHWRVEDRNLAKLRSSLLSTLPHELFTPLAGIMGLAEFLRTNATIISLGEIQDLHNDIFQSALRLNRTLKNYLLILDLDSSSEAARPVPPLLAAGDARLAIQAGVDAVLTRTDRTKGFTVELADVAIRVEADDLKVIAEELVDNACKFSRIGAPVAVYLDRTGTLIVADGGRGMAQEEIDQIGAFQQFDRKKQGQALQAQGKAGQDGLGLGLILSQKLAFRSGAKLSIASELGRGTQVRVAFQTAANPAAPV